MTFGMSSSPNLRGSSPNVVAQSKQSPRDAAYAIYPCPAVPDQSSESGYVHPASHPLHLQSSFALPIAVTSTESIVFPRRVALP